MNIEETAARAIRLQEAADKAFERWFNGIVESSSAAVRLQRQSEEAWADLRLHPDFEKAGGFERWPEA